jgi:hypothetical protein
MSSQSTVMERVVSGRTPPYWEQDENALEAAFIYADDSLRDGKEVGHVDYRGDIYDDSDHRVGHVTAAAGDVGEVYRGYNDRLGQVRVAPNGDGYIYTDPAHKPVLRGVVTARGEVYKDGFTQRVAIVKPPLDAERMGAAVLLLDLL